MQGEGLLAEHVDDLYGVGGLAFRRGRLVAPGGEVGRIFRHAGQGDIENLSVVGGVSIITQSVFPVQSSADK